MTAGQILSFGVGFATGVYLPVGESLAMLGALSFSREQEQEADLLGAQMMAEVGLDPHATYRVWQLLSEEEQRAVDKGEKGLGMFRTHPRSEDRLKTLREWAVERFGPDNGPRSDARFVDLLTTHYRMLMDDQIDTNRYSRTEVLLERHAQLGIDPAVINYYRGEMHRQRGAQGDAEMARDAYLSSISTGRAVPEAYRNVGYLYLKAGDTEKAREHFRRYLEAAPAADDRAMIESYLVDE
jgi:predicted Zn-dependent protease